MGVCCLVAFSSGLGEESGTTAGRRLSLNFDYFIHINHHKEIFFKLLSIIAPRPWSNVLNIPALRLISFA